MSSHPLSVATLRRSQLPGLAWLLGLGLLLLFWSCGMAKAESRPAATSELAYFLAESEPEDARAFLEAGAAGLGQICTKPVPVVPLVTDLVQGEPGDKGASSGVVASWSALPQGGPRPWVLPALPPGAPEPLLRPPTLRA